MRMGSLYPIQKGPQQKASPTRGRQPPLLCLRIYNKKRTQLFPSRGQHAHISQRGPGGTQPPGPLLVPGSGQERGLFSAGLRLSGEFPGNRLSRAVLQKFFPKALNPAPRPPISCWMEVPPRGASASAEQPPAGPAAFSGSPVRVLKTHNH